MAGFDTYADRQAFRDSHPGWVVDASGAYNPSTGQTTTSNPSSGGGGGAASSLPQTAGDTVYQTPNGPRTAAQMTAELQAVGWGGGEDPATAYARTTGGAVTPSTGGSTNDPNDFASRIAAAFGNFGAQASGVTQAELAERKRQFDLQLEWTKQMWQQQGLPQLVIQQRAQELAQQEFESQKQLAQQAQALATAGVTGMYQGSPTLQAQQQAFAQEAARAGLGLQYLQTAAGLGGPENVFQQSNFYRGAQGNPNVPLFLQSLASNTRMPVFQSTGTPANVLSVGSIANQLAGGGGQINSTGGNVDPSTMRQVMQGGGIRQFSGDNVPAQVPAGYQWGSPGGNWQANVGAAGIRSLPGDNIPQLPAGYQWGTPGFNAQTAAQNIAGVRPGMGGGQGFNPDQSLAAIRGLSNAGAQSLAPGSLERLSPDELAAFGSGLKAVGNSLPAFLQQYAASRLGQGATSGDIGLAA